MRVAVFCALFFVAFTSKCTNKMEVVKECIAKGYIAENITSCTVLPSSEEYSLKLDRKTRNKCRRAELILADKCKVVSCVGDAAIIDTRNWQSSSEYTVDLCIEPDDLDGNLYRGTHNTTVSGRTCQKWTSQSPNEHERTPQNFPNEGLGDHNYCRNPWSEDPRPWCYNAEGTSPGWEYCDVPVCTVGWCAGEKCRQYGEGVFLPVGHSLTSRDGHLVFTMQEDGNLVLYCAGQPIWQTHTNNTAIFGGLEIQGNGNLVLYSAKDNSVWTSGTDGNSDAQTTLVVQNDRNVVLYNSRMMALWSTETRYSANCGEYPGGFCNDNKCLQDGSTAGIILLNGKSLQSENKEIKLMMTNEGLGLYCQGTLIWQKLLITYGASFDYISDGLVIQGDGNLVMYNEKYDPVWSSRTNGNPGGTILVAQNDKNVVLYDSEGNTLWSTGTANWDCRRSVWWTESWY